MVEIISVELVAAMERLEPHVTSHSTSPTFAHETSMEDLPHHLQSHIIISAGVWKELQGSSALWWHVSPALASSHASSTKNNPYLSAALVCSCWRRLMNEEPLARAGLASATFGVEEAMWRVGLRGQTDLLIELFARCNRHGSLAQVLGSKDKNQRSLLSRASEQGHASVVETIINSYHSLHLSVVDRVLERDQLSRHSVHWAAARGRQEVLRLLIHSVSDSSRHATSSDSLSDGNDGQSTLFELPLWSLLFSPDCNGQTPIQLASYNGHQEAVYVILEAMHSFAFRGTCPVDPSSASHPPPAGPSQPSHVACRGGGRGFNSDSSVTKPLQVPSVVNNRALPFDWMADQVDPSTLENIHHESLLNDIKVARTFHADALSSSLELSRLRKHVSVYRAILSSTRYLGISANE